MHADIVKKGNKSIDLGEEHGITFGLRKGLLYTWNFVLFQSISNSKSLLHQPHKNVHVM